MSDAPDPSRPPSSPPPRTRPRRSVEGGKPAERASSLVMVNTGDGKGKSTAAFGTVLRAVARGWQVAVVQFIKSGAWRVGEEEVSGRLGVDWWTIGDGFTWDSDDLDRSQAVAAEAWRAARGILHAGRHDLVVLDEITYPMNWGWIDPDEVIATIASRPEHVNIVATGRDAPQGLIDIADTVTEMRAVKHAYDRGVPARRGIDY